MQLYQLKKQLPHSPLGTVSTASHLGMVAWKDSMEVTSKRLLTQEAYADLWKDILAAFY